VVASPAVILFALNGIAALSRRVRLEDTDFLILPLYLLGSNLMNRATVTTNLIDQAMTLTVYILLIVFLRKRKSNTTSKHVEGIED
jgi:hypothetical protein